MARRYAINDNLFIFKQKPIFGIGYNEEILPKLFSRSDYSNRRVTGPGDMGDVFNILHPHNFLLRSLSNTGLMGTSVLFCIIYLVFRRCYALIRTRGDYHQIGIFLFCSIFFFLIFSLMNTNFFSEGYVFWILCGIAAICGDDFFAKDKMPAAEL
jgi:O-antigen ligase